MPNLFITREIARGYFWEAIPKVCPEAFEDLASLVDDYVDYLSKNVDPKEDQELFAALDLKLVNERDDKSESATVIFDMRYEEKGTVIEWQKKLEPRR